MPKSMLTAYDIAVRVSALEAIAGLPVRSWPGDRRGLMMAAEHFGGKIHPEWVSEKEQGIALGVERKAHDALPSEDAEDLTARVLGGLSVPSDPRGEAGAAAKKVKSRVLRGEAPSKTFRLMFIAHTAQRAKDVSGTTHRREKTRGQDVQIGDVAPGTDDGQIDIGLDEVLGDGTVFLTDNRILARWIQIKLDRWPVRSEKAKEVAKAYFQNPGYGRATELAKEYGVTKQAIKKTVNKAVEYLTDSVRRDPRIQDHLEMLHGRVAASVIAEKWLVVECLKRLAARLASE